jgi:hypothetical protein
VKTRKPAEKSIASSSQSISLLLQRWSNGDEGALEQLMPLVYGELRRMARRYMGQQPSSHTLQTTALIHEAYLRLAGQEEKHWENRAHFFGVAPRPYAILVDYARARITANVEWGSPSRWRAAIIVPGRVSSVGRCAYGTGGFRPDKPGG